MLPLLTFELVLADQFCMIIYKKKNIFWHWGLWIWWLDVMETLISCGPWQKKMEDIFFFKLISLSCFIRLIGFWKLWVMLFNEICESCPLIDKLCIEMEFYLLECSGCQNYRFRNSNCSKIGVRGKWILQMLVKTNFSVQFWLKGVLLN